MEIKKTISKKYANIDWLLSKICMKIADEFTNITLSHYY